MVGGIMKILIVMEIVLVESSVLILQARIMSMLSLVEADLVWIIMLTQLLEIVIIEEVAVVVLHVTITTMTIHLIIGVTGHMVVTGHTVVTGLMVVSGLTVVVGLMVVDTNIRLQNYWC